MVLYDSVMGQYYCSARAHPTPEYAWLWIKPDGQHQIVSASNYLDLRPVTQDGFYVFRCIASNVVSGVRHTKIIDTKLRVIGRFFVH